MKCTKPTTKTAAATPPTKRQTSQQCAKRWEQQWKKKKNSYREKKEQIEPVERKQATNIPNGNLIRSERAPIYQHAIAPTTTSLNEFWLLARCILQYQEKIHVESNVRERNAFFYFFFFQLIAGVSKSSEKLNWFESQPELYEMHESILAHWWLYWCCVFPHSVNWFITFALLRLDHGYQTILNAQCTGFFVVLHIRIIAYWQLSNHIGESVNVAKLSLHRIMQTFSYHFSTSSCNIVALFYAPKIYICRWSSIS